MKLKSFYLSLAVLLTILLANCTINSNINNSILLVDKFMPSKINQQITLTSKTNYHNLKIITEFIEDSKVQLRQISDSTILIEHLELKDDGIYSVFTQEEMYESDNILNIKPNKNELILKSPLKVGTSWTGESGAEYKITSVDCKLETYAGNFNTIEVTSTHDNLTKKTYFAEGLGIIKIVLNESSGELISNLEIFSLQESQYNPKEYRFYYYDVLSDKIVYTKQIIPKYEPERMSFYMISKLKNPPNNLIPSVGKTVKVNNIIAIPSKNFVAIDFSSNFVTDLNVGSSVENSIIQCIVNTFGYNFYASEVIITINGEPYSSGHISMEKNVPFKVDFSQEEELVNY